MSVLRSGYVALVGRPNAGKSTLFNTILGQRLSIVTAKPQTTRQRVLGILTRDDSQTVFLDTPGLLESSYRLHQNLERQIERSTRDADLIVLLLDAERLHDRSDLIHTFLEGLGERRRQLIVVLNKVDAVELHSIDGLVGDAKKTFSFDEILLLSALRGTNVSHLLSEIGQRLPPGPALYPPDMIADQPERFFTAELVREAAFERLEDELPYSIEVVIDEFREPEPGSSRKIYIHATLFVERDSQKGIVIGNGGKRLRSIGSAARPKIEELVEGPVYLELRVKVRPNWRSKERDLREFGYV
jgi:GTP-binding protein Era